MPRIDPVTGCEVMTFFEFIDEEGKLQGKRPSDIMGGIYEEMAKADKELEKEIRNPEVALLTLKNVCDTMYEDWASMVVYDMEEGIPPTEAEPIRPEKVIEVLDATSHEGFSGYSYFFIARVLCVDGIERIVEYHYQHWTGSRLDPDEWDEHLEWHNSIGAYHSCVQERKRKEEERKKQSQITRQEWLKTIKDNAGWKL